MRPIDGDALKGRVLQSKSTAIAMFLAEVNDENDEIATDTAEFMEGIISRVIEIIDIQPTLTQGDPRPLPEPPEEVEHEEGY